MFEYSVQIVDSRSGRLVDQSAWVDTGAFYSQFPASTLKALGYQPDMTALFRLADGSTTDSPIGDVRLRIGEETRTVACVFGEENGETLLGATALEVFRFSVDIVNKTLVPTVPLMLTMLPADDVT